MSGGTEILKTDGLGRVRVPRERQEQLLDEFERSGLSGAKYAALCGVKYPSFAGWVHRRKRERAAGGGGAPPAADGQVRWLEALLGGGHPGRQCGVLRLHFPCGACAEISDAREAALAAELLRALHPQPPSPPARPC